MKLRNRLVCGAIALIAIAGGSIGWSRAPHDNRQAAPNSDAPSPDESVAPRERQSVGWVFGRLMGFPGAERPLTSTVGPSGMPPPPPSRGIVR